MSTDTTPTPILPARLERAAYEIEMMMQLNGHKDWRYGPIAERALTERLLAEKETLIKALQLSRKALREMSFLSTTHPHLWPEMATDALLVARAALKGVQP